MSNEIEAVVRVEDIEHNDRIEFGEWGLEIKQGLTIKDWLDAVLSIQKYDGKIQWYLGDLAVYAESPTTGWGESKYQELIDATGYDYDTLRNYANVARRFQNTFREQMCGYVTTGLSWNHFRAVAPLEDNFAAYFLQKAAENAWGVARLREEIRNWRESRGEVAEREEDPIGVTSFKDRTKDFFRGFIPNITHNEYDEKTWLLEVHDVIEERLHELGIEL